jgi:hypothetical protein
MSISIILQIENSKILNKYGNKYRMYELMKSIFFNQELFINYLIKIKITINSTILV